jgi:hypothetical protein
MNTFVERLREGGWGVWTAADGGSRLVSRHTTRDQAEQALTRIRGGDDREGT